MNAARRHMIASKYGSGLDALAGEYDWRSLIATGLKAGGEIAQTAADRDASTKAAVAQGEAAFTQMKSLAEAAKWPADISPIIIALDKTWQAEKGKGNVPVIDSLTAQMRTVAAQLQARMAPTPASPPPRAYEPPRSSGGNFFTRRYLNVPVWGWGIGALALTGLGIVGWRMVGRAHGGSR